MISEDLELKTSIESIETRYFQIRNFSEKICKPLEIEDYIVQPILDVSPPKWHLAHTTWFFETFILLPFQKNYKAYHPRYNYIFNSYYNNVGDRVLRHQRGALSRPTVEAIYEYRSFVDQAMLQFLKENKLDPDPKWLDILNVGLQHEQQHQELLFHQNRLFRFQLIRKHHQLRFLQEQHR